jgi:hypothetical protein
MLVDPTTKAVQFSSASFSIHAVEVYITSN